MFSSTLEGHIYVCIHLVTLRYFRFRITSDQTWFSESDQNMTTQLNLLALLVLGVYMPLSFCMIVLALLASCVSRVNFVERCEVR